MTWLSVAVHVLVMIYAVRMVCLRMRDCRIGRDRRMPAADHVMALQVGFGANALVFALAVLADATDGGRRFEHVRVLWELSNTLCIAVAALAIRVLLQCRRMGRRRDSQKTLRRNKETAA